MAAPKLFLLKFYFSRHSTDYKPFSDWKSDNFQESYGYFSEAGLKIKEIYFWVVDRVPIAQLMMFYNDIINLKNKIATDQPC